MRRQHGKGTRLGALARVLFTSPRRRTCALFLAASSVLSAQQPTMESVALPPQKPIRAVARPTLTGSVGDASGAAITGATVTVRSTASTLQKTTQTDKKGAFSFPDLPVGSYRVVVSAFGFQAQELPLEVGEDDRPLRIVLSVGDVSTSIDVEGREDDLSGIADSATQGTVGAAQLRDRPLLRSGEVLETVPGLIVTQHAGGGKANQYFLRGFNLDHGTDFAIFLDDMPLNLPSHAHGEGYADMNTVIPEFVKRLDFEKGPYYADVGNYGSAGSAHLEFFKTLPENFVHLEGGTDGFGRGVFGISHRLGQGELLLGGEVYHDDGPWIHPDNYYKFNGLATYSKGKKEKGFSITARAYDGSWNSSDQIPTNAVPVVGYYGTLNPTDGGHSQRYSLQAEWHHQGASSITKVTGYGFFYDLNLFSDFTYLLTDPTHGDQFNQRDRRWVAGLDVHHTVFGEVLGRKTETTFGLQLREDWIHNGLFQSEDRMQLDKIDVATGTILPATTQADRFTDTQVGVYTENRTQWAEKLRSVIGFREDAQIFDVTSLATAANSGTASKLLPSPKAGLVFGPWFRTEFYAQGGFSFHSNDGRGTVLRVEPVSADNPYPNTPAAPIPALIPTRGGEFGVRTTAVHNLQSTVSVWYLHSASELQQDGDTGGTVASQQPSERYGVEWANFYTPLEHVSFDFDLADSKALFVDTDAGDAAPNSPGGKRVPEAVGFVLASGATMHDVHGFTSSLRLRYFGPRDLTSDSVYRSHATALLNAEVGYRFSRRWQLSAEVLNLLNRKDHDIDYAYTSRISPEATPAFTDVFHPVEPFQCRFRVSKSF